MNSPCFPAARAEPATASSAAVMATAGRLRTRSEVSGELHTAWANHRSAPLKTGATARGHARVSLGRPAANRKVEHRSQDQARAAHCEGDRGNVAFLLGGIDSVTAARRTAIARTLPVQVFLFLHCHHAERSPEAETHGAHAPGHVGGGSTGRFG